MNDGATFGCKLWRRILRFGNSPAVEEAALGSDRGAAFARCQDRPQIDLPHGRRLRPIPKSPGICRTNLESLQNAAFPFATGTCNQYRFVCITEGFLP
jgi:hypothetical protein